jgi:hypothetical protein
MRGLRHRDKQLLRLKAELRANRSEPPRGFIRALVKSHRGEARWVRPRLRIGLAVALVTLALAAVASAGGFSVVQHGTRAAVDVIKRTTHTSAPRTLSSSPANAQYKKHCGISTTPKCHITIFDASVREGSTGTTTIMTFTLSLDATNDAPVTVDYATSDVVGGATGGASCGVPGVDYISKAGTVVFPTGSPSATINIIICGDALLEPNETFHVNLFNPSPNADIYRATATGTIVNDDK